MGDFMFSVTALRCNVASSKVLNLKLPLHITELHVYKTLSIILQGAIKHPELVTCAKGIAQLRATGSFK
jgi:hypothetical protein